MRRRPTLDIAAASAAGMAGLLYGLMRAVAPDANLWSAGGPVLETVLLRYALPSFLLAGFGGWLVAAIAPGESDSESVSAALRPLWMSSLAVGLALPLREVIFHDPAPLCLLAGLAVGGLVSAWRLLAVVDGSRPAPIVAFGAALVGLVLLPVWPAPQGDEPHYLTVAHSIVEDGDLDVADDYRDRVFGGYHADYLSPHYRPGLKDGSRYSMHGVGYALFLAPAYAAGQEVSPWMAVALPRFQQILVYALFAWLLVHLIAHHVGAAVALRGGAAAVLLAPLVFAPLHLFPEVPAMTLSAAGFLLLTVGTGWRRAAAAGLCLALLPWIGVKYLPLMLATAVAGMALGGVTVRRMLGVAAPVMVTLAAHAMFTWSLYGSLSPSAVYLGADPNFTRQPGYGGDWWAYVADWRGAVSTLGGYFLDQKEGLLAVAPHFLVVGAGGMLVWRRDRRLALALMMIGAAHLAPYALSQQLGGQSPPARPLMAVAWVLALPLAAGLGVQARPVPAAIRGVLVTLAAAATAFLAWDPSLLPHDYGVRASWMLRAVSPNGWEVWRWFPSWVNVSARPWGVNIAWLVVVGVLAAVLIRDARFRLIPEQRSAPFRPAWGAATVALLMLLVAGLAVAATAVSDRHQGVEISPGVQAWTIQARPEVAWPEPGGVWGRPGVRRDIVVTTASPIGRAELSARSLLAGDVDLAVGEWSWMGRLLPETPLAVTVAPGVGHSWRGRRAYRGWLQASDGVPPAVAEGGEDWRELGAFMRLVRRPDEAP